MSSKNTTITKNDDENIIKSTKLNKETAIFLVSGCIRIWQKKNNIPSDKCMPTELIQLIAIYWFSH